MQAASREAWTSVRAQVESVLPRFSSTDGLTGLADEFYAVANLLDGATPVAPPAGRPGVVPGRPRRAWLERLLEGKVSASALAVVLAAVAERWSLAWDLVDAIESSGDDVLLAAAEKAICLDEIEDELFRFERILDAESSLSTLLDEATATPERRIAAARQRHRRQGQPADTGPHPACGHDPAQAQRAAGDRRPSSRRPACGASGRWPAWSARCR